ncbi:CAP domain-containing protein [Aurantimonas sp. VKM B-3413]|uniref:CAP domain-containing protein n=1 Tax=Aurantimonas sp. VKM B-3413 TaxID=2779401 RepID=UPI001E3A69F0|nr:CAP domain-containing protein [Aurantimonas sp. VKM B-3413]MCB8837803.1 CAP domain-containing protein [Aurantimonas sp. VKM B-3413]
MAMMKHGPNGRSGLGRFAGLLALAAMAMLSACAATPGEVDVAGTRQISVDRAGALAEINAFRAGHGLGPVHFDAVLDKAAERQARAMAARGRLSHTVDGDLSSRMQAYGYRRSAGAENIGWNYRSTSAVMSGWENSPGHRENLLNPRVSEAGFAAATGANGEPYWALILGAPR